MSLTVTRVRVDAPLRLLIRAKVRLIPAFHVKHEVALRGLRAAASSEEK